MTRNKFPPVIKKPFPRSLLATFLLGASPLHAAETNLNPRAENTIKNQVLESMIGYRDTLLFYTFATEKAVLSVRIDNKTLKFPITATLHFFAKEITSEGLAQWINNQHSCGLYPDVPEPTASHVIPATSCSLATQKMIKVVKTEPFGTFHRYNIEFKIENIPGFGSIKVKDFTDTATVLLKTDGES